MMIFYILGAIFIASYGVAYYIASKYSTSSPVHDKVSIFANLKQEENHHHHHHHHHRDDDNNKSEGSSSSSTSPNQRFAPTLSIVIPCYNEEERLPIMLDQTLVFCEKTVKECAKLADPQKSREIGHFSDYEIIVVDDCSKDKTVEVFESYKKKNPQIKFRICKVDPNRGKGFAVRTGFLNASGDYVLMADGDGATQISDVCRLLSAVRVHHNHSSSSSATSSAGSTRSQSSSSSSSSSSTENAFIGVGSRAHLEQAAIAERTFIRTVLMKLFHFVVQFTYFCGTRGTICHIHDTQCGFKLFDRRLCEPIFLNNRLERFAFDVELFICAKRLKLHVLEVKVNWKEVPGSKVNLKAMAQMGLDCLLMCFTYGLGIWKVKNK